MIFSEVVARTDVGMVRDHNEDAHLILRDLNLLAVADGMGGLAHGEVASSTAISTLRAARDSVRQVLSAIGDTPDALGRLQLAQTLELLTNLCNTQIQRALGPGVSGSTLVMAFGIEGSLLVCNTGDSRTYLFRDGTLRRLTEDHTVAAAQLRAGVISQEEHDQSPYQHMLYQALGTQSEVDPDLFLEPLAEGDLVLVCSDGLTGPLTEPEIAALLATTEDLEQAADMLIEAANDNGGPDNITLILARSGAGPSPADADRAQQALESSGPLSELTDYELRMLQLYMEVTALSDGRLDPAAGAHVVLEGLLHQGERALGPGAVFGLMGFADERLVEPGAEIVEPARVALITAEAYDRVEQRRPLVAARLLKGLFRELARTAAAGAAATLTEE